MFGGYSHGPFRLVMAVFGRVGLKFTSQITRGKGSGGAVAPLSFSFVLDHRHAHDGGTRNWRMVARMARTIGSVTATSANLKVMARA